MVQAAAAGVMRRDIFLAVMFKHHSPPEHVTKLKSPQTAFVNVTEFRRAQNSTLTVNL